MYSTFELGFCSRLNCHPSELTEGQRSVIKRAFTQIQAEQPKKRPFYKNPWVLGGVAALAGGATYAALGNPAQDLQNITNWVKTKFSPEKAQITPSTPNPVSNPSNELIGPPSPYSVPPAVAPTTPAPVQFNPKATVQPQFNTNVGRSTEPFKLPEPKAPDAFAKELAQIPPEHYLEQEALYLAQQAIQSPDTPHDLRKEVLQFLQTKAKEGKGYIPPAKSIEGYTGLPNHLAGEPIMPALATGGNGQQFIDSLTKYRSDLPSWAAINPNTLDVSEVGGIPYLGALLLSSKLNNPLLDKALVPVGAALDVPLGYELGDFAAHAVNDKLKDFGLSTYDEPPALQRRLMGIGGAAANSALNLLPTKGVTGTLTSSSTGAGQGILTEWMQKQKERLMNDNISSNWMQMFTHKNKELHDVFAQADQGNPVPLQEWVHKNKHLIPAIWKTMTYIHGDPVRGNYNRSLEMMMDNFHKYEDVTGIPLTELLYGKTAGK